MLTVLLKNNQLLAVAKPAGMPIQDDPTGDLSLQKLAEMFCKHPLHTVHRIDRPVSGVVLFAKSPQAMVGLQKQFEAHTIEKIYLAVVQNMPPEKAGKLTHFLLKKKGDNVVRALANEAAHSEKAELEYELIGSSDKYNLLKIRLLTGRHHQIRAQLAAIGCPIKGDVKYGARRSNADRSIHLHSWKMAFDHPVSLERFEVEAPFPEGDAVWDFFREKLQPTADAV